MIQKKEETLYGFMVPMQAYVLVETLQTLACGKAIHPKNMGEIQRHMPGLVMYIYETIRMTDWDKSESDREGYEIKCGLRASRDSAFAAVRLIGNEIIADLTKKSDDLIIRLEYRDPRLQKFQQWAFAPKSDHKIHQMLSRILFSEGFKSVYEKARASSR